MADPDYEYRPQSKETRKKRSALMKAICKVKREHRAKLTGTFLLESDVILAKVTSYEEVISALKDRADDLGLTRLELDDLCGLHEGHTGKILGMKRVKNLGKLSEALILEALGVHFALIKSPKGQLMVSKTKRRNQWSKRK